MTFLELAQAIDAARAKATELKAVTESEQKAVDTLRESQAEKLALAQGRVADATEQYSLAVLVIQELLGELQSHTASTGFTPVATGVKLDAEAARIKEIYLRRK